jgi:hypothetical protein
MEGINYKSRWAFFSCLVYMAKVGRPLQFKNAKVMQKAIDAYFLECKTQDKPTTIQGLALSLDLDRNEILNYQGRKEFTSTVKRAKEMIQNDVETRLLAGKGQVVGQIFWLKNNANYRDNQQLEVSGMDQTLAMLLKKGKKG